MRKIITPLKVIIVLLVLVLLFFTLKSIWLDTLLPLINKKDYRGLILNLGGISLLLTATGIIIYGGFVFVRDTFALFQTEDFSNRVSLINKNKSLSIYDKKKIKKQNTKDLLSVWKKGSVWLAIGFLLFIIGGIIINL